MDIKDIEHDAGSTQIGAAEETVHSLVSRQAVEQPDRIAVRFDGRELSYGDLEARTNRVAHHLRGKGLGPGKLVGVCVERSEAMLVGLLGILKSGCAYVPIDPAYPDDRVALMIEDSGLQLVVTENEVADSLKTGDIPTLRLDGDWEAIATESDAPVPATAGPDDLAYVIYTSGSTGRPKGVEIPHRAVVNFLESMRETPGLSAEDRLLAVTTLSFDIAGLEMYLPLIVGAQVVIASRTAAADGVELSGLIESESISVMQATPATWRLLLDSGWNGNRALRVLCGGETLTRELADRLLPLCAELWNLYGPTETTIWSTVHRVEPGAGSVPIGKPIANTDILVLDEKGNRVEGDTPGELFIGGGAALARGYRDREELTAERFVDNLPAAPGERFYRTGDRVRYRDDGTLEHLGRLDFQVKVRGFRIELGEIEAALDAQPSVKQAIVLAREDIPGEKRLVAYVVPANEEAPSSREMRAALAKTLPDYMVPGLYVQLDSFPLTPNGKVDRKMLPAPDLLRPELANEYVEPRTDEERKLAEIWAEVLRVDRVGADDNFFELGGDSLHTAQVGARIREVFEVDIPLRTMFERPTVAGLAPVIASADSAKDTMAPPMTFADRSNTIPVTFAQERVWFLHQVSPRNLAYNFASSFDFYGTLDRPALQRALGEILRRHESYRTGFPTKNGKPHQYVYPYTPYTLPQVDLTHLKGDKREAAYKEWCDREFDHRFDLAEIPLVRWTLLRFSDEHNVLMHMEQHLVHDGWSFNVFIRELVELYRAYSAGEESTLEELPIQLADFAAWQRDWMSGGPAAEHQLAHWRKRFATIPPVLNLPFKGPRPKTESFTGTSLRPEIPVELCNDLRALSREENSTLFMTMMAAFFALLHRYTGETDVAVGTFFANRRSRESETVIGMILNNVVIRLGLDGDPTVRELLAHARDVVLEDSTYQDVPFNLVVDAVQPKRDMSKNPLFHIMFSFHDEPMPEKALDGLDVKLTPVLSNGSSKFDLGVIGIPHSAQRIGLPQGSDRDGLTMIWEHNTDLFETETIARMIEHYKSLLRSMVENPDQRISELTLADEAELKETLVDWNETKQELPLDKCLHDLVAAQAAKTPDADAVRFGDTTLTYSDLDQRANRLAQHLRKLGAGPEVLVGLCVDRSEQMLIALLGILKSGAAYVPIDPTFPEDRKAFMIEDAKIGILVTQKDLSDSLPLDEVELVRLDQEAEAIAAESSDAPEVADLDSENLAYVIYTSGSTGRPKGVQLPHRAVVNFLLTMQERPGLSANDRLYAVTTLSFDIAGLELFLPLVTGAQVIIGSRAVATNGEELAKQLVETGATVMQATPSTWQMMLDAGWSGMKELTALCGGEALPRALAQRLVTKVKALWNMYGPTETTIWSVIQRVEPGKGPVPIGRPLGDTTLYLLDRYNNPVPVGVVGELCIGGAGVARGYLNRPELTAERFIDNPVDENDERKIYRTGDLARYRPDGSLEFLGRNDHQIKLRGFRIEPGEIEAQIAKLPDVSQVAVIMREDVKGDARLVAYAVPESGATLEPAAITDGIKEKLPNYMVPSACVILESMPLTPNGKLDRNALPAPTATQRRDAASYVAPRNATEELLQGIWHESLGVSPIGVKDDFFDAGGHSLLAVALVAEIDAKTGQKISIAALLQGRTIEHVAKFVGETCAAGGESSFVALRSTGTQAPFFAVGSHPRYREMTRHLGSDQPIYQLDAYALQSQRRAAGQKLLSAIEDFAEHFIGQIRRVQPHGPYKIGGGCEGAYVAYEIATRLQEQGEEVSTLLMWIPPALRESRGWSLSRFAGYHSLLRLRYLITGGQLFKMKWRQLKVQAGHELVENRILKAICSYEPSRRFDGKVTIIRTEESPNSVVSMEVLNQQWIDRASEGGEVVVVPGNHQTWMHDHFEDFARMIGSRIQG